MSSVIEICNMALAKIGQGRIDSITEASPQAEQCSLFYPNVRDSLLRQFPWNFCSRSVLLAQIDVAIPGWTYTYAYPSTVLHVRSVFDIGDVAPEIPNEFEIVSTGTVKYICSNLYQAYARCTYRVEDPTMLDPIFVEALSCKLALEISMTLTNTTSRTAEVSKKYDVAIGNAMMAGAIEGSTPKNITQLTRSSRAYITSRR